MIKIILIAIFLFPQISFANNCWTRSEDNMKVVDVSGTKNDVDLVNTYGTGTWSKVSCDQTSAADLAISKAQQDTETLIQQDERALAIADLQSQGILSSDQTSQAMGTMTALQTAKTNAVNTASTGTSVTMN